MKKYIAIIFIIQFFAASSIVRAADSLTLLLLDLRPVNISAERASSVRALLRSRLEDLKNCEMVSENKAIKAIEKSGFKPACSDKGCAVQFAKLVRADRAIYGSVQVTKRTYDRQVGTEGANKYLLAKNEVEQTVTTLYLIDVKKGTVLTIITDASPANFGDRDAERLALKLRPYFVAEAETKKKDRREAASASKIGVLLYAGAAGFMPLGTFRGIARGGAGATAGVDLSDLAIKNSRVGFQAGYYYITPATKKINYHHAVSLLLRAGYQFNLPLGFAITPLVGAGYTINLLSEDIGAMRVPGVYRYSPHRYYDPLVMVKFEFSYRIGRCSIFLAPAFTAFFEKKSDGMFISADVGAGYNF